MANEDNLFRQLEALAGGRGGPPSAKPIVAAVLVVIGILLLNSSFFTIEPEEVGIILRFGEYEREAEPGLRFKLPVPIEVVIKVPIERQLKEEFGFRTREAGVRTTYEKGDFLGESLMLTGDLNVAVVQWIAQYRVREPRKYLFKVRGLRATFRDLNEAVMREVVGDRTVNDVLTVGRQAVASEVKEKLQELCDQYETGIKVEQIVLQDVNPPDPVKPSFNEVNQAQQEKERLINEAQTAANKVIPRARGEAQQAVEEAKGYATDRINRAQGDALAFTALHEAYKRAPEVTHQRLYLETMAEVFPKVKDKVIVDAKVQGILPMLSLEKGGAR